MTEQRPFAFRFRLPWFKPSAPPPPPTVAPEPPRTTMQTRGEPLVRSPWTNPDPAPVASSAAPEPLPPPPVLPPPPQPDPPAPPPAASTPPPPPPPMESSTPPVAPESTPPPLMESSTPPVAPESTPPPPPPPIESSTPSVASDATPLVAPKSTTSPPPPMESSTPPVAPESTVVPSMAPVEQKPPSLARAPPPLSSPPRVSPQPDTTLVTESLHKPIKETQAPLHKEIRADIFKFVRKMTTTNPQNQYTAKKPTSVVTLTGNNKGSSMQLRSKREHMTYNAIDGEGSSKKKKPDKDSKSIENLETNAIINSNVEGINNSMVFESSVTERNPGVHLGSCHNLAILIKSKNKNTESTEMDTAQVNVTSSQKLTYEPTIGSKRVFAEMSDSEQDDDAEKIMRNGCLDDKSNNETEIDII